MNPRFYISPTEPKALKSLGHVTLYPETLGCDVVAACFQPSKLIGFQRKAVPDLLHSLNDGRLSKELGQIASSHLAYSVLVVEGTFFWTSEGTLANNPFNRPYTRRGHRNVLIRIQSLGIQVVETDSIFDTIQVIQDITGYLSKKTHNTLETRPKTNLQNSWGRVTNESFASHLLQSFPGIGPETAKAIYAKFSRVPIQWTVTAEDLMAVDGIGRKTAERLIESLSD